MPLPTADAKPNPNLAGTLVSTPTALAASGKRVPMQYVLTSFQHESNIRTFSFDGIDAERKRTPFTVCVDLGLIRKYEISLQELPLLCCYLLGRQADDSPIRALTFTEAEMQGHADRRAAAVRLAEEKKSQRKHAAVGGQPA
jgi:hypothetical protein